MRCLSFDSNSGRSDTDGFAIASPWYECYLYSQAACCVWSLTGSIRPSLFSNLGIACLESCLNHFRFCRFPNCVEMGFHSVGGRAWFLILVHRRKCKLRKYANCIILMRNRSSIKRRKGDSSIGLFGLSVFIRKLAGYYLFSRAYYID